jgi:hypothetical protein
VEQSKLQEKLAMRDKQLAETRNLVKNLKKREEQLLEKYEILIIYRLVCSRNARSYLETEIQV